MAENKQNELVKIENIAYDIISSEQFKEILNGIPIVNEKVEKLLATPANEEFDEDEVKRTQDELDKYRKYHSNLQAARTSMRKQFNTARDYVIGQYDEQLKKAGVDKLAENVERIKERKKLVIENRKKRHWDELEEHYNNLLESTYPNVKEKLSDLDFNNFQSNHDSLIKGAKSFKVNDKVKNVVSEHLNKANKDLEAILNMNSIYEDKLLKDYTLLQDLSEVFNREQRYKDEDARRQELQAKKIEAERLRIEKENKKREQIAKLKNEKAKVESTEHIKKLNEVYNIVTKAVREHSDGISDDLAKKILNDITNAINS